jgi:3-phenylpropionate/trans-cinnamate dioxygenase ferredoxin reductase subunit
MTSGAPGAEGAGRVVIVGASLAGLRAAESLREEGHEGPITVIGAEQHQPYDRPPLSKQFLAGTISVEQTSLGAGDDLGAEWVLGTRATGVDLARRTVLTDGLGSFPFDSLVIATGAHPRRLPAAMVGGSRGDRQRPLAGVHELRTLDDALSLKADLEGASSVAVIGAGFIGSEVASTCRSLGLAVTVVEALPVPMVGALGAEMGLRCAKLHTDNGVGLRLGSAVERIAGRDRVEGVHLADGSVIGADVVVVGIGVTPTVEWLSGSGFDLDNGLLCDQWCRVLSGGKAIPGVVAAGDVARAFHPGYGVPVRQEHWTNAAEQAHAAATTLLAGDRVEQTEPFAPIPYFWSDQYGTKLQFVGRVEQGDRVLVEEGPKPGTWVAAYGRQGRIVAALGARRPSRVMALRSKILEQAPWPPTFD